MKKFLKSGIVAFMLISLAGCLSGPLQRGMLNDAYISTARPSITLAAKDMPLLTAGRGQANLWSEMLGGLPIQVWLAVYGNGGLAPLAIVAQADTPSGWYWDGIMRRPFSVDDSVEVFDGVGYQACTFIVNPAEDPFGTLVTGVKPDGEPQQWLVRAYAARFNFNDSKIIMEYREPLPDGIVNLTAIPYGQSDLLAKFAQRAREALVVSAGPVKPVGVVDPFVNNIAWQYMGQNFLGTASPNIKFNVE